jgi:hypothetical protein
MVKYVFRDFVPIKNAAKLDAQKVGESLERIFAATTGADKADAVWRAAQSPRHYLHKCFEWDVQKAAEAHWHDTAENIIRVIRVQTKNGDAVPAYISVSDARGTTYHSVGDIIKSADLQTAVMRNARRDLVAWQLRYQMLRDICDIVAKAEKRISEKLGESESAAKAA